MINLHAPAARAPRLVMWLLVALWLTAGCGGVENPVVQCEDEINNALYICAAVTAAIRNQCNDGSGTLSNRCLNLMVLGLVNCLDSQIPESCERTLTK